MSVVWLTGPPASGKTTLGERLVAALGRAGVRATLVDSDEARRAITPTPRYDDEERALFYRALAYTAQRLAGEGVVAVVAATAHTEALREAARTIVPDLLLVHVDCPGPVCEARDPKGLYAAARAAGHGHLPGVHEAYTAPATPDVRVDGGGPVPESVIDDLVRRIVAFAPESSRGTVQALRR